MTKNSDTEIIKIILIKLLLIYLFYNSVKLLLNFHWGLGYKFFSTTLSLPDRAQVIVHLISLLALSIITYSIFKLFRKKRISFYQKLDRQYFNNTVQLETLCNSLVGIYLILITMVESDSLLKALITDFINVSYYANPLRKVTPATWHMLFTFMFSFILGTLLILGKYGRRYLLLKFRKRI